MYYQNVGFFEKLGTLPIKEIIEIFEKIYAAEMLMPDAQKDKDFLAAQLNKVLEGTIFAEKKAETIKAISESFDRLVTFDRTFLLTIMNKPEFFEEYFIIKNSQKLEEIVKKYNGAVITLAHAGPHIVLINFLSKLNSMFHVSAAGHMPDDLFIGGNNFLALNGFTEAQLLRFGDNFFETCLENLKRDRILLLYPEYSRSHQRAGATTSFLGKTVNMPLGSSRLSHHSGKPILPAFIRKVSNYRFELEFGETILPPENDEFETHIAATAKVFKFVEDHIIANPQDWEGWQYYEFMTKHVGQDVVEKKK